MFLLLLVCISSLKYEKDISDSKNTKPEEIVGIVGDLIDMESMFIFKEFFNKTLNSSNLECRTENTYLNPIDRMNLPIWGKVSVKGINLKIASTRRE